MPHALDALPHSHVRSRAIGRRELGDFQTPPELAREVLGCLGSKGWRWPRVLEPTCGKGHFLTELVRHHPGVRELWGIEIQPEYAREAAALSDLRPGLPLSIKCADLFQTDLAALPWTDVGPLLVVGNPPWVTASELGALGGVNRPAKRNVWNARGLDALTGASNFDAAEAVWLKLLSELPTRDTTIALLCKASVAQRVLLFCHRAQLPVAGAALVRIDAARWFGAAVEACLFTVELREGSRTYEAEVFDHVQADAPARRMGVRCDGVVPDLAIYERYAGLDGRFPIRWRQGVKHDAASALELKRHADGWLNSQGEPVEVESDYLYPLLKGTDVHRGHPPSRKLLLPQRTLGEDTHTLAERAPKAWSYLQRNLPVFERRKSSIYRNRPPFSVFGVGPYALAPFKVAVSGLHSALHFRAVGPECGRPVLFDDTCYFLPCRGPEQAALLEAILNSDPSRSFFSSLVLPGAKRPVTQRILQRLEVARLIANLNAEEITASARRGLEALGLGDALSASSLAQEFRSLPDP